MSWECLELPTIAWYVCMGGVYTLLGFWGRKEKWGPIEGLEKGMGVLKGGQVILFSGG